MLRKFIMLTLPWPSKSVPFGAISAGKVINKVTRVPEACTQALVTPSERHLERNHRVPGRPGSWGPPWNLLVSLQVSLRGSYKSLKAGFRNSSYFVSKLQPSPYLSPPISAPSLCTRLPPLRPGRQRPGAAGRRAAAAAAVGSAAGWNSSDEKIKYETE
jgi:hypothetical protein